ncbi:MAG: GC-type dockerin domain-anchored protein [Phycisphaerales bacterium]
MKTSMCGRATIVGAWIWLGAPASAQVVYSQNFETNTTASWVVHVGPVAAPTDGHTDFFFDYSTVGIPTAPSGAGTHGLKLQANLTSAVFGGLSVSPVGLNVASGDFRLRFDWWANVNGPFPTSGNTSTNLSTFGIGTSGTLVQFPGSADCVWFAATGDGGSGSDYRAYSSAAPTSYPGGNAVYISSSINNTDPYYAGFGGVAAPAAQVLLFPQQTGLTAVGTPAMAWHRVEIAKADGVVTWTVDNLLIAAVPIAGLTIAGGNICFGHADVNSSVSTNANAASLLFTLIDNVVVERTGPCNAADLAPPFGVFDFSDVIAYLTAFGAMDPDADLDLPIGVWDFSDVIAFLTTFAGGCP